MRAVDLIRQKRDGAALDSAAIDDFVRGVTDGSWPDYQTAALLMAVVCRGMTGAETAALTEAMVRSGQRLRFDDVPGPKLDKHSTGGVGDKISLVLAPLLAACGAVVPMMSGRGLGHTGGTLDKLEAVPGLQTTLSARDMRRVLTEAGCCIAGPSDEIAPADRRLYALRDVTGTIESVPLITASILSKKLAEGLDALVFDVKVGRGAFMRTEAEARVLAESLVEASAHHGLRAEALLTRMDAPLGRAIGNAVEVREALETLAGRGPTDVESLSVALAARVLCLGGVCADEPAGRARARAALSSGAALERFRTMLEAQGGDPRIVEHPERLPAGRVEVVPSPASGIVTDLDAKAIGLAAAALGAARRRAEDTVDPAAGVVLAVRPGDGVERGQPLAEIHGRDAGGFAEARQLVASAFTLGDSAAPTPPLVIGRVGVLAGPVS